MATIAMMLGGAVVNALAFSGSSYMFSLMRDRGVDEERVRHDKAIEELQTAHEAWSRRRVKRLDWINEELKRQNHAIKTFRDVDTAIREYSMVTGNKKIVDPEPQLSDYYTPSDDQKDREIAFVILGMAVTGLVAYKLSK